MHSLRATDSGEIKHLIATEVMATLTEPQVHRLSEQYKRELFEITSATNNTHVFNTRMK